MGNVQSLYPNLDSESFGTGKRHYFIDVKKAVNNSHFLLISRSDQVGEEKYVRKTIQLWEEDLGWFAEALMMILSRLAHGQMPGDLSVPMMELVKEGSANHDSFILKNIVLFILVNNAR